MWNVLCLFSSSDVYMKNEFISARRSDNWNFCVIPHFKQTEKYLHVKWRHGKLYEFSAFKWMSVHNKMAIQISINRVIESITNDFENFRNKSLILLSIFPISLPPFEWLKLSQPWFRLSEFFHLMLSALRSKSISHKNFLHMTNDSKRSSEEGSMCRSEITLKYDVSHEGFLLHWCEARKNEDDE